MKPVDFNLQKLIDDLTGTDKTIAAALPEGTTEEDLTEKDMAVISMFIFRCDNCDKWYDNSQEADADGWPGICVNCIDEVQEYE